MSVLRLRFLHDRACRCAMATACILVAFLAVAPSARTAEPAVYAIVNARIVPVSSPVVEKGTVLLRNGVIEAVGASVAVPGDARVIDAGGSTVYPGLIDALSDIGIEEPRAQAPQAQRQAAVPAIPGAPQQPPVPPAQEESRGLTPYRQAVEVLSASHRKIEQARNAGVTTTMIAPRPGFFAGQSTVINLSGNSVRRMVVKNPVAFMVNMSQAAGMRGGYPSSMMGIIAYVKQTLLDAQRYDTLWAQYQSTPGVPRPEYDRALESLQPVLKRQMPVIMPANTATEIERAMAVADAFKIRLILSGGMEAAPAAATLKQANIPVLISVKYPERARDGDPEEKEELEALRRRVEAPANAAALAKAGVRFAFMSDDTANPRDFVRNVGRAVQAGLDRDAALRALTLNAAEILGIADRCGSIEKNKTANLIVTTGDIFAAGTRIKYAFIDGEKFDIPEPEPEPARGGGGPAAAPPGAVDATGTWNIVVNTPQGPVDVSTTIRQSGPVITGSLTSSVGAGDIFDGKITGNVMSFKVTISPPGMGTMEVLFTGTIQGTQISGTASVTDMGPMDFTGTKAPGEY